MFSPTNRFSWAKSFREMLKELHDLAGQHEVIAENIQGRLVQEAQKLVTDMKNERKQVGFNSHTV